MEIKPNVKFIIGLGNPGKEYEKTFHNVGFLAVDFLAKNPLISNFQFLISKPIKSGAFMNQSGSFVAKALKKFGVKPTELLIIHDDSDIELGNYKISFGRGSAGHNGVESIIKTLGSKNFWRLRIGIRPKVSSIPPKMRFVKDGKYQVSRKKAEDFVLKKINKTNLEILEKVFKEAIKNIS